MIFKGVVNLGGHFLREDMQTASNFMETCSALIIREVVVRNDLLERLLAQKPKVYAGSNVEKRKPNMILMGFYCTAIFKTNTEALKEKAVPLAD